MVSSRLTYSKVIKNFPFVISKHFVGDILRLWKYPVLQQSFHRPALVSIDDSWQNELLLWWLQNGDFLTPSFLIHIFIGFLERGPFPPSSYFSLFLYLYLYGLRFLFFHEYSIAILFILMLKLFQIWPVRAPQVHFYVLWHILIIFSGLPYFLAQNIPGSFCTFSASALNQPFLQSVLASESEEWYLETKIWVLGVFIATGVSWLTDSLSGQREGM